MGHAEGGWPEAAPSAPSPRDLTVIISQATNMVSTEFIGEHPNGNHFTLGVRVTAPGG